MATFKNYSLVAHKNFAEQRDGGSGDSYGSTFTDGGIGSAVKGAAAGLGAGAATYTTLAGLHGLKDTAVGKPTNHVSIRRMIEENKTPKEIAEALVGTKGNPAQLERSLGELFNLSAEKPELINQVLRDLESRSEIMDAVGRSAITRGSHAGSQAWFTSLLPGNSVDDMTGMIKNWNQITDGLKPTTIQGLAGQLENAFNDMGSHRNTQALVDGLVEALKKNDRNALTLITNLMSRTPNSNIGQQVIWKLSDEPTTLANIMDRVAELSNNPQVQASRRNIANNFRGTGENIKQLTNLVSIDVPPNYEKIKNKSIMDSGSNRLLGTVEDVSKELRRRQIVQALALIQNDTFQNVPGCQLSNGQLNVTDANEFADWFNTNKNKIRQHFTKDLQESITDFIKIDKEPGRLSKLIKRFKPQKIGQSAPSMHLGVPKRKHGTLNKPGNNIADRLRGGGKKAIAAGLATIGVGAAVGLTQYWNRFSDALHDSLKSIGRKCIFEYDSKYFGNGAKFADTESQLRKKLKDRLTTFYKRKPEVFNDANLLSATVGTPTPKYVAVKIATLKSSSNIKLACLAVKICYLTDIKINYEYTNSPDHAYGDQDSLQTVSADVVRGVFFLKQPNTINYKNWLDGLARVAQGKIKDIKPEWKLASESVKITPAANVFNGGTDFDFHEEIENYAGKSEESPLAKFGFGYAQSIDLTTTPKKPPNNLFARDLSLSEN